MLAITDVPPLTQSMYEKMSCPASYQAEIVQGLTPSSNPLGNLSIDIHAVMAEYAKHLKDEDVDEDWPFFESLLKAVSSEAQQILRGFIGMMKFNPRTILTTEYRFEYSDISGKPDLVTMESPVDATIFDYKNYFEMVDADTFQSKMYSLLIMRQNSKIESVRFVLVFMRYGKMREVTYKRAQLAQLEAIVATAKQQQIKIHETEGLARAIPGRACDYCSLLATNQCQVNNVNPRAQMSDEDRLGVLIYHRAAANFHARILQERARDRVIHTTDANGRVYEAGFKLTQKRTLPLTPALHVLNDHFTQTGENLADKARISMTSLASLRRAKSRIALDKALRAIEAKKDATVFHITDNPEKPTIIDDDDED